MGGLTSGFLSRGHVASARLALSDGKGVLTYGQLRERVLGLAGQLVAMGVVPGDVVAVAMDPRRRVVRRMVTELPENEVVLDLEDGGRWTSLRMAGREWLWQGLGLVSGSREGMTSYVDVGGLDECFPTVRGTPDHSISCPI